MSKLCVLLFVSGSLLCNITNCSLHAKLSFPFVHFVQWQEDLHKLLSAMQSDTRRQPVPILQGLRIDLQYLLISKVSWQLVAVTYNQTTRRDCIKCRPHLLTKQSLPFDQQRTYTPEVGHIIFKQASLQWCQTLQDPCEICKASQVRTPYHPKCYNHCSSQLCNTHHLQDSQEWLSLFWPG